MGRIGVRNEETSERDGGINTSEDAIVVSPVNRLSDRITHELILRGNTLWPLVRKFICAVVRERQYPSLVLGQGARSWARCWTARGACLFSLIRSRRRRRLRWQTL